MPHQKRLLSPFLFLSVPLLLSRLLPPSVHPSRSLLRSVLPHLDAPPAHSGYTLPAYRSRMLPLCKPLSFRPSESDRKLHRSLHRRKSPDLAAVQSCLPEPPPHTPLCCTQNPEKYSSHSRCQDPKGNCHRNHLQTQSLRKYRAGASCTLPRFSRSFSTSCFLPSKTFMLRQSLFQCHDDNIYSQNQSTLPLHRHLHGPL